MYFGVNKFDDLGMSRPAQMTYLDTWEASVQDRNKYWEVRHPAREASVEAVIEVPLT